MSKLDLTDETISKLAKELIVQNKEIVKSENEKKLRDIRLLLTNYRFLKNHLNIEIPTMTEDSQLSNYELSLYSLIGYRVRSKEMLIFFNNVLEEYKSICFNKSQEAIRKYRVIDGLYINEHEATRNELSMRLNADIKTIRRDEKNAIEELSVMTFGIDGINDMTK